MRLSDFDYELPDDRSRAGAPAARVVAAARRRPVRRIVARGDDRRLAAPGRARRCDRRQRHAGVSGAADRPARSERRRRRMPPARTPRRRRLARARASGPQAEAGRPDDLRGSGASAGHHHPRRGSRTDVLRTPATAADRSNRRNRDPDRCRSRDRRTRSRAASAVHSPARRSGRSRAVSDRFREGTRIDRGANCRPPLR